MLDLSRYEVLTFDCYGTLIDWERGILSAVRPLLSRRGLMMADDPLLEMFARAEALEESGPYRPYAEVLRRVLARMAEHLAMELEPDEMDTLSASVGDWPPFPDTAGALEVLASRFRIGILSNVDEDMFARTRDHLPIELDAVVTAELARVYKPALHFFEVAEERLGVDRDAWLHVAQSRYHDIAPATAYGLRTVHVDRRKGQDGDGATMSSDAAASLTVPDLKTLADMVV